MFLSKSSGKLESVERSNYEISEQEKLSNRVDFTQYFDSNGNWISSRVGFGWSIFSRIIEDEKTLQQFESALNSIAPYHAKAFLLCEVFGLSAAEVCVVLGLTAAELDTAMYTARLRLLDFLRDHSYSRI
jgi:DNA-directed RNA polymerase specialized sigma24 family protein